jgi:2,3-bisphosphoglycerate-independent phosphoglycerate mutase
MRKRIVLIIRDGWGINKNPEYNAVTAANTPNIDAYLAEYPHTVLEAAGVFVGLPEGYQGSSEVGHLNMGAGRVVVQELTRINDSIQSSHFFKHANFQRVIDQCKRNGSALHVMGLVQDEGVHAHQDHLFAIMKAAKQQGIDKLYIHFFADGRDTPPRSAPDYLRVLENKIKEYQIGQIATLMGRYYAMDRAKSWELTDRAYNALTRAEGIRVNSAQEAIQRAYDHDRTPDGSEMFDEYIPPSIIGDFSGIRDGDAVVFFNYRQDRAIQLTQAFVEDDYAGRRWKKLDIAFAGLTRYYDSFRYNVLEAMDSGAGMQNILGEVISRRGIQQLRISETQKFKHVTSFFNGKLIKPFPHEDRIEIKSMYDPATFAQHPEMNAYDVTAKVLEAIKSEKYDLIVLNFANCDMVGHTGDYQAVQKAVEVVDSCVGKVVRRNLEQGYISLITADHGNAEEMIDYDTGLTKTAHTKNPVEFIYVAQDVRDVKLRDKGILSDIAPTILELLEIDKPAEMTAESLII